MTQEMGFNTISIQFQIGRKKKQNSNLITLSSKIATLFDRTITIMY
jgi:hypothetical protein